MTAPVNPTSPGAGNTTDTSYESVLEACQYLAFFDDIATEAGKNLTVGELHQGRLCAEERQRPRHRAGLVRSEPALRHRARDHLQVRPHERDARACDKLGERDPPGTTQRESPSGPLPRARVLPGPGIGAALSDPTIGGPTSPGPSGDTTPADLAHLVVDSAAERKLAAEAMPEFLLPEDMLPGAGEDQISLREGLRSYGSRAFVVLAIIVTLDNLQTSGLAVACTEHPVVVPCLHRRHHVRGGDCRRFPRPGDPAHGLARRPLPASTDHRLGHLRVRADGGRHGLRHEHLRLLPGPLRRRHFAVEHQQRPRLVAGGYLSDQHARPDLRRHGDGPGRRHGRSAPCWSVSSRPQVGGPNGWRWAFYILAIPIVAGGRLSRSASRSRPAGSSRRRTSSGRSSATHHRPRPRSRRPSSGSCASARSRRS